MKGFPLGFRGEFRLRVSEREDLSVHRDRNPLRKTVVEVDVDTVLRNEGEGESADDGEGRDGGENEKSPGARHIETSLGESSSFWFI